MSDGWWGGTQRGRLYGPRFRIKPVPGGPNPRLRSHRRMTTACVTLCPCGSPESRQGRALSILYRLTFGGRDSVEPSVRGPTRSGTSATRRLRNDQGGGRSCVGENRSLEPGRVNQEYTPNLTSPVCFGKMPPMKIRIQDRSQGIRSSAAYGFFPLSAVDPVASVR